jgi:hypothetical protein
MRSSLPQLLLDPWVTQSFSGEAAAVRLPAAPEVAVVALETQVLVATVDLQQQAQAEIREAESVAQASPVSATRRVTAYPEPPSAVAVAARLGISRMDLGLPLAEQVAPAAFF